MMDFNSINSEKNGMFYIEKFRMCDVVEGASENLHPAFVIDGNEIDGFYISKYQNCVLDKKACSICGKDPAVRIDFDSAQEYSRAVGDFCHLMSAYQWGAIALICKKNKFLPFGNNDFGKDVREESFIATPTLFDIDGKICRVASGTGPKSWSHNNSLDGIYDLNGNIWEWTGGVRLVFGEVQIFDASPWISQSADSPYWKAIDGATGELITPDGKGMTPGSVKLDYIDGKWTYITGKITNTDRVCRNCRYADVTADSSVCQRAKEILYALAFLPDNDGFDYMGVSFFANNGLSERVVFRGGKWNLGMEAGIFKSCLDDPRSFNGEQVGFRYAISEIKE